MHRIALFVGISLCLSGCSTIQNGNGLIGNTGNESGYIKITDTHGNQSIIKVGK